VSVNKTPRGLKRGVKGVGSLDQRNVCKERKGEKRRKERKEN